MKNTKQDINNIPIFILKEFSDHISVILCDVMNMCMEAGRFPGIFKDAIVVPIFKKSNPYLLNNYRPISLLVVFGKIFEKCINSRIVNFDLEGKIFY